MPNDRQFLEIRGKAICPVCGHCDRCKYGIEHPDDLRLCFRMSDPVVNGFRRIKQTRECATYIRIGSELDGRRNADSQVRGSRKPTKRRNPGELPVTPPQADLNQLAEKYAEAITNAQVDDLARELGVSPESLRAIGIGFDGANVCFPERDASGNVTAINTRLSDGTKSVGAGQRRGLTIPSNLDQLPDPVLLVEGATDVAACLTMGLTAVGRPNNSGGADLLIGRLRGRRVIVVGENDCKSHGEWPGRDGAERIAGNLSKAWGISVPWAMPPRDAKDARAYLQGRRGDDPIVVGRDLLRAFGTSGTTHTGVSEDLWPEPQPLADELPAVQPFEFDLLPDAFSPWIKDIAERMQCPPDYSAVASMVSIASVVGRKIAIRPKERDDWTVVPNLFGAAIGRSGIMKTPAMEEPLRPLKRLEIEAKKRFDAEMAQFEAAKLVSGQRRKVREKAIRKAIEAEEDPSGIAASALAESETPPVRRRHLVNDSTVEKLGELLNENPNGVLVFRDELTGFLKSLEKEGCECSRAFYLEAWNGTGRYTYDRIGRGTIDIEAAIVSIIGGIQPGPLAGYLRGAIRDNEDSDGLMQRFQLAVWPDVSREWKNVDEWPDSEAKNVAYRVFQRLNALDATTVGATRDSRDPDGLPFLRFDPEAQLVFNVWREELERKLRSGDEHPAIESHLSKYRSLIPSLALVLHLVDDGVGPIPVEVLRKAIRWGVYLESHARRIYSVGVSPDFAAAKALAQKILNSEVEDGFSARDVYRHHWSGLASNEDVGRAVDVLLGENWLREEREQTGGRTAITYRINPKIFATPPDSSAKGAKSRSTSPSGTSGTASAGGAEILGDESDELERRAIMHVEEEEETTG